MHRPYCGKQTFLPGIVLFIISLFRQRPCAGIPAQGRFWFMLFYFSDSVSWDPV
jgi:hypothetical protein